SRLHFDAVGQHKGAAKLSRCDPAMDEFSRLVVFLPAADHELAVLKRDLQLFAPEAGERKRNAQGLHADAAAVAGVSRNSFDIVRGITVAAFANPVDEPFHFFKPQQQWARQQGNARHGSGPPRKRPYRHLPRTGRSRGTGPDIGRRLCRTPNMGTGSAESRNGPGTPGPWASWAPPGTRTRTPPGARGWTGVRRGRRAAPAWGIPLPPL